MDLDEQDDAPALLSDEEDFDADIEEMMVSLDASTIKKYTERLGQLKDWLLVQDPTSVRPDDTIDFHALKLNTYFRYLKHRLEVDLVSYDVLRVRSQRLQ
jgi:hypothetical protein